MSEFAGHENLETVTKWRNFTRWIYEQIFPSLQGNILEVGSGLGTFSELIIHDFPLSLITLSDISPSYVKNLEAKFSSKRVFVCKLDLNNIDDYERIGYEKFDSIIAINVLEHIENDERALRQLYKMLKKDGVMVILVPANKFLYNVIDESIGHWRRYTKKELETKVGKNQFRIERMFSFNILGMFGWYINGNLCKNPAINKNVGSIFDKLVHLMKIVEKMFGRKIGLSIICIARK